MKFTTLAKSLLFSTLSSTLLLIATSATAQNIYVANWFSPGPINVVTPGGSVTPMPGVATGEPEGLAFDGSGDLFVSDSVHNQIDEIIGGVQSTFVTGLNNPDGIAFDTAGNLYVADHGTGNIYKYTGTTRSTFATGITDANELAFDAFGNLYVSGNFDNMITKITPGHVQSTFASGGYLGAPNEMAFDSQGNMYVANGFSNSVVEITVGGTQSIFATGINGAAGLAMDNSGNIYVGAQNIGELYRINPSGTTVTPVAGGLGNTTAIAIQGVILPVPEPSTWALAIVGGTTFLFRRLKK